MVILAHYRDHDGRCIHCGDTDEAKAIDYSSTSTEAATRLAAGRQDGKLDRYGHTEADHEAAGACRRPSMDARGAAAATEYERGSDLAVAYERGWDARAAADADLRSRVEALTAQCEAEGRSDLMAGFGVDLLSIAQRLRAALDPPRPGCVSA